MRRTLMCVVAAAVAVVGFDGCGGDKTDPARTVNATMSDYAIQLDRATAPSGPITFKIKNNGPSEHEFAIFRTDLAPEALPVDLSGDVDDDAIDSVEDTDVASGKTETLDAELVPGKYVIICKVTGHYQLGMRAGLTLGA